MLRLVSAANCLQALATSSSHAQQVCQKKNNHPKAIIMYFEITTNKAVAAQIKKLIEFDERTGCNRSYLLGDILHKDNFSTVQIKPRNEKIAPSDIFWLGYFSALIDR